MAQFTVSYFFRHSDSGWSETYHVQSNDYPGAAVYSRGLLTARLALLCMDAQVIGCRISNDAIRGDGYSLSLLQANSVNPVTFPVEGTYSFSGAGSQQVSINQVNDCVLLTLLGNAPTKNRIFLRGIADNLMNEGVFVGSTAWTNAFLAYKTYLINSGFQTRTRIRPRPLSGSLYSYGFISAVALDGRIRTRRAGRPFDLPRGRRRVA